MILKRLQERFDKVLLTLQTGTKAAPLITKTQDSKFGDYQSNVAMQLAKQLGKKPRDIAQEVINQLDIADICEPPEIAGAGFINLRLKHTFIAEQLQKMSADTLRLGIPETDKPKTFIVDYSAPNVAKPMHVGHIRSTIIGSALAKMLRFYGHRVITDNHIGDWGTQFGMIIYGYRNFLDKDAYQKNPVEELSRVYRFVRQKMDEPNEETAAAVLEETAKLHRGDAENLKIWNEVLPHSKDEIDRIYRRLNIVFDHTLGESFYQPMLADTVADLLQKGIAKETEGAVGVFFGEDKPPFLIRKKDGAFLYGTTDLATVKYRWETFKPDVILYVVDFRQSLHFEQLFKTVEQWSLTPQMPELLHIKFGTVLGEDNKPFKTRSGDTIGLNGLLDEAVKRANGAEQIGIGAVIYADLSQNRESDYVFSYDKMLAMNGNTATYMQYAYARIQSIFSKVSSEQQKLETQSLKLETACERALALDILRFGEALDYALKDYRPNVLTAYLFDLANKYSAFFEQCPVLKAETNELQTSRLLLCRLTARTLQKGLELLGIETVERM